MNNNISDTPTSLCWYRARYPFQGNAQAAQLGFMAGAVLVAKNTHSSFSNGWIFGRLVSTGGVPHHAGGWFPSTYVGRIEDPRPRRYDAHHGTIMSHGMQAAAPPIQQQSSSPLSQKSVCSTTSATTNTTLNSSFLDMSSGTNVEDDDDDGFGGAPMGGKWNSSGAANPFGTTPSQSPTRPNSSGDAFNRNQRNGPTAAITGGMSRAGGVISKAASRTGAAISKATSDAGAAISHATKETGHRLRDMQDQNHEMNKSRTKTIESRSQTHHSGSAAGTSSYEKRVTPGGGILPGVCTETSTQKKKTGFGSSETTTTSTSRHSGGFFPGIRGKTTTVQTVKRGPMGQTTVHTETKQGGGFFIIPLGPVGLLAAGALAAKHAHDSHKDRQRQNGNGAN